MKFIDETSLFIQSGKGGPGCVSFRREKFVPRGGPDGGDGGKGGDVIFRVNKSLHSLVALHHRRKLVAGNGQPGQSRDCSGADGEDLVIEVPVGTIIRKVDSSDAETDLQEGEVVLFRGGRGGKGNAFFMNSVNQAPQHAQPGEGGVGGQIVLELKLIADVGIIGFPNVGKSTLISRLSAARPKVADYPFTTLVPNLGVMRLGDTHSVVLADMPGLIPGAHKGVGLGTQFLRHIEKTKVFVHVIDASGMSNREPCEDLDIINSELGLYDQEMLARKQIVVLNKADVLDERQINELKLKFTKRGLEVLPISAVTGEGIAQLKAQIGRDVLGQY